MPDSTPQQTLEAQLEADLVLFGKIAANITVDVTNPLNLFNISGDITLFEEIVSGIAAIKQTIADFKAAA
jgi:hypothetical protein